MTNDINNAQSKELKTAITSGCLDAYGLSDADIDTVIERIALHVADSENFSPKRPCKNKAFSIQLWRTLSDKAATIYRRVYDSPGSRLFTPAERQRCAQLLHTHYLDMIRATVRKLIGPDVISAESYNFGYDSNGNVIGNVLLTWTDGYYGGRSRGRRIQCGYGDRFDGALATIKEAGFRPTYYKLVNNNDNFNSPDRKGHTFKRCQRSWISP